MYSRNSGMPFALYAYAGAVLRASATARRNRNMTRDEAERMLRSLFRAHGVGGAGRVFEGGDVAGAMLGEAELFFEYEPGPQSLWCGALIYRFRAEPRPGVLENFFDEERSDDAPDTGGGALEYMEATRSLLLSRTYRVAPAGDEFADEVRMLAAASLAWAREVAGRAASARHERGPAI